MSGLNIPVEDNKLKKATKRWHEVDDRYFTRTYGGYKQIFGSEVDPAERFSEDIYGNATNFVNASKYYPPFRFGEAFGGHHKEVQVNTIQIGDKVPVTYEEKITHEVTDWGANTSAHGIPQIVRSQHICVRMYWALIYICCVSMFMYQAVLLIQKFNRNEKIVDIELKFEAAPFPAITLCNLNPYKESASRKIDLVNKMLGAFSDAMNTAASDESGKKRVKRGVEVLHNISYPGWLRAGNHPNKRWLRHRYSSNSSRTTRRHRREGDGGHHKVFFELSKSDCECTGGSEAECMEKKEQEPIDKTDMCYCAFDRHSADAWPCYKIPTWEKKTCDTCNDEGFCPQNGEKALEAQCYCAAGFCIAWDGQELVKLWEYFGSPPTEDPGFLEAMGFTGMTDEVAIVTRAKENMMFAMSALSMMDRKRMSYTKEEFVHKCSFNGKQCDIDNDFITLVDPTFGNCFMYNHNRSVDFMSIRAGPNYGLRLVLFTGDEKETMATTEATGVRLTIHDKDQFPFPDTFGYSAPTGSISSFGMRKKMVQRLPAPYGQCLPGGNMKNYIYDGFEYSVEVINRKGCFRSCFQMAVVHECECGDPRFPVREPSKHCKAVDPAARKCLDRRTKELGGMHGEIGCMCPQPCHQSMYDVTYSAAIWPAPKLKVQPKDCIKAPAECAKEYAKYGAMIEVFYEQLNFEMLIESSAYGWVNVMSDFGGQLGLWLGVSVITCFEFFILICNFSHMSASHQYQAYLQKKREEERAKMG